MGPLLDESGRVTSNNKLKADLLPHFFESVYKLDITLITSLPCNSKSSHYDTLSLTH